MLYAQGERKHRPTSMGCDSSVNCMGFVDNGTGKHQSNMVYSKNGLSRCIDATDYKHSQRIVLDDKRQAKNHSFDS